MKKILFSTMLSLLLVFALIGCTVQEEVVKNEMETAPQSSGFVMESIYADGATSATQTLDIDGEDFGLVCTYNTAAYPLKDWRVTDNKTLSMTVNTINLPDGYKVHIEHVHADIVLKSTTPQIDGITQDSMDDHDHRIPSAGFPINDTMKYKYFCHRRIYRPVLFCMG